MCNFLKLTSCLKKDEMKILIISILVILNFGALYLGALLMGGSPASNSWYIHLNKAPWTPPGAVFGLAWTTIMLCLTWFISLITGHSEIKPLVVLYGVQLIFNVLWNPLFFNWHLPVLALVVIILLFVVVLGMFILTRGEPKSYLILPYLIWLVIAISLNAYVVVMN
jgi:benzodiazapine receptor